MPAIIAKENQNLFSGILPNKNLDEIINDGIDRLIELKGYQGWSWWNSNQNGTGDIFTTAYVTEYLIRARKIGYDVPQWVFDDIKIWAERYFIDGNSSYDKEQQVAAKYILSLFNDNKDTSLISDTNYLPPDVLSLAVLTNINNGHVNNQTNGANQLLAKAKFRGATLYWEAGRKDFYASQDASTAMALRALTEAKLYDDAEKVTQYFASNKNSRFWSNTFATAQALEALTSYAKVRYPDSQDINYEVVLDNKIIAEGNFSDPFDEIKISIDNKDIKNDTLLVVRTLENSPLFSMLHTEEFRTANNLSAESNGVSVHREYVGDFVPGETIDIILTIKADEGYQDEAVVIQDYLPAGLVPINPNLENEKQYSGRYGTNYPSGIEVNDDGVMLAYRFWDGEVLTAKYQARIVSRGEYTAPPAVASLMYQPESYGRSQISRIRISDNLNESGLIYSSDTNYKPSSDINRNYVFVLLISLIVGVIALVSWTRKKRSINHISDESL